MILDRVRARRPGQEQYAADGERARLSIAEGQTRDVEAEIAGGAYRTFDQFRMLQRLLIGSALTGVGDTAVARRAAEALAEYVRPETALDDFEKKPVWWTGWLIGAYHATYGNPRSLHDGARSRDAPLGGTSRD
jgi:hypothetical protein